NLRTPLLARGAGPGAHRTIPSFQSMFLQPAIHGAATESQGLGCLTDVPLVSGESALDEVPLHFVEAHLLQLGRSAGGLRAQAEIRRAHGRSGRKEHAPLHRVIQFANVARPGMLMIRVVGCGNYSEKLLMITRCLTVLYILIYT